MSAPEATSAGPDLTLCELIHAALRRDLGGSAER
jgi:hypothetical protein